MQAVIAAGGKQYLVRPDDIINLELLGDDKQFTFDALMVIDGDKINVGTPLVDGATVTAELIGEVKGDKVKVLRFKAKKRVKRLTGHRQRYTQVKITKIAF
jgi:large subunit ribosomal protein L21